MPDEVQNDQTVVVEETQPEEVITSNETENNGESEGLPENASDRTREQFEKLKKHNQELAEKVKKYENIGSPFDALRPPLSSNPVSTNVPMPFQDGQTENLVDTEGYIDDKVLKRELAQAKEEARKARIEAQYIRENVQRIEENQQVREAHREFPQLDPKSEKFNPKFFEAVKNKLVSQMIAGERDLLKASKEVAEWFPLEQKKEISPEQIKKEEQARRANLSGTTVSHVAESGTDQSDLERRTRLGDTNALLERLRRSGF